MAIIIRPAPTHVVVRRVWGLKWKSAAVIAVLHAVRAVLAAILVVASAVLGYVAGDAGSVLVGVSTGCLAIAVLALAGVVWSKPKWPLRNRLRAPLRDAGHHDLV